MQFYPADAAVPDELRTQDLLLQPLTPDHVHLDYDTVMSSQEQLLRFSNGLWPVDGFPLEENLEDLTRHDEEHRDREAFTYTVLNPDGTVCEGCVYISPWEHVVGHPQIDATLDDIGAGDFEAVVTFWIRSGSVERGLERQLVAGLLDWFEQDWSFQRILFMTNNKLPSQVQVLEELGLSPAYRFGSPTPGVTWLFYGQDS